MWLVREACEPLLRKRDPTTETFLAPTRERAASPFQFRNSAASTVVPVAPEPIESREPLCFVSALPIPSNSMWCRATSLPLMRMRAGEALFPFSEEGFPDAEKPAPGANTAHRTPSCALQGGLSGLLPLVEIATPVAETETALSKE